LTDTNLRSHVVDRDEPALGFLYCSIKLNPGFLEEVQVANLWGHGLCPVKSDLRQNDWGACSPIVRIGH